MKLGEVLKSKNMRRREKKSEEEINGVKIQDKECKK